MSFNDTSKRCKFCGSGHIFKLGLRKNRNDVRQRYKCKDCERRFSIREYVDLRAIFYFLNQYYAGHSFREIANNLAREFQVSINYATLSRWIKKFEGILADYKDTLGNSINLFEGQSPEISNFIETVMNYNEDWNHLWQRIGMNNQVFLIITWLQKFS